MTGLKILFVFSIILYYSGFINISQGNNDNKTILTSNYYRFKEYSVIHKEKLTDPTLKEIIQALEQQIVFWKTASKEEIADHLGVNIETINSVSDTEFNEIKLDNAWLYENIIKSLNDGKSEFEVISTEDNSFKISFKEKAEDSLLIIMKFKYENNKLMVDKKN